MITVAVNGQPRQLADDTGLDALVTELWAERQRGSAEVPPGVAAAVNGEVVRRADWPHVRLKSGDHVELVTAVQGG